MKHRRSDKGPLRGGSLLFQDFGQEDLAKKVRDLLDWLGSTKMNLPEISYSSIFKQSHFKYKLSVWAKDIQQFRSLLQDWLLQKGKPIAFREQNVTRKAKACLGFFGLRVPNGGPWEEAS